jgi:lysozyme
MVFQLGFDGVKNFKKMLTAIHAKDYVTASKEMLDSKWNKQTPKRAKRMSDLMAAVK